MKFYSVRQKQSVEVSEDQIKVVKTKNNRYQAVGKYQNETLYKFISEADAKKYDKN
jgi:hypothetical protein